MPQKVAIVSDSTFDLPEDLTDNLRVTVAPVHLLAGGQDYRDRLDITIEQANRMMLEGKVRLTTAAASAADYLDAYERALELAPAIVALAIPQALSATYNSAKTAIELLEQGEVTLIDTRTVGAAQGLIARRIAGMALQGAGPKEVAAETERLVTRARKVLTTRSDAYTKQGGRYSQAVDAQESEGAFPVFRVWEKGWREIERASSRREATDRLIHWMHRDLAELGYEPGGELDVAVDHVVCPEDAEELRARVEREFSPGYLGLWQMAPTESVHLGPGTLGVAYLPL